MKSRIAGILSKALLLVAIGTSWSQTPPTVDSSVRTAKIAAGTDWAGTFLRLCIPPPAGQQAGRGRGTAPSAGGAGRGTPARETWYAEPAKVADNLYFL